MKETWKRRAACWLLAALGVGLLAAAGAALVRCGAGERIRSAEDLREIIEGAGPFAGVAFFLLQMMTVVIAPIPSNVTMMAGALALGFWPALLLGMGAIYAGSMVVFLIARRLGRKAVQGFVDGSVMEKYLPIIEEKQDMFLFLTLLFPFFPDDALCILAGLTTIPTGRFALIMLGARPWGLLFAAFVGSGALSLPPWAWAAVAVPMLALFVLMMKHSARIENVLIRLFGRISGRRKPSMISKQKEKEA